jgi:hypothetical protein
VIAILQMPRQALAGVKADIRGEVLISGQGNESRASK